MKPSAAGVERGRLWFIVLVACCYLYPRLGYAQAGSGSPEQPSASPTQPSPSEGPVAGGTVSSTTHDETLGSEAALSRSLALYESGQYQECVSGLTDWLRVVGEKKPAALEHVDQARTYLGACLIASGKAEMADQVFREAIRNNPQMRAPDALVFPQTVVDRFLRVREQLLADIRRDERGRVQDAENRAKQQDAKRKKELLRQQRIRALAEEETVVETNRRWLASIPFGVGQFQNGDNAAGWAFLATEAVLAGTCVTALVIDGHLANRSREPGIDPEDLRAKRLDAYRVIVGTSWGLLGVAAGGVLHAHWRFVPERRRVQKRQLPPELEQTAEAMPSTGKRTATSAPTLDVMLGPVVGVMGRF